ncbi:MAG TPA: CpsB/CapC family capsule biosynthesis tyrosine phosphatase, partial [Longimicrobiales bacterium]
ERLAELDAGCERLRRVAAEFPELAVGRGCEVMLDVPEPSFGDERLRLCGGATVLVEFPFMMVPPQAARPLAAIVGQGFRPLLAHAERYAGVTAEGVEEWRGAGAGIQVNGPSLLGKYGDGPRRLALELLERGLVDCLASDYHARSRPLVADYRAYLMEHGAEEQAALLMDVNPARAAAGERLIPIGPVRLRRPGLLNSISSLWRRPPRRRERG